MVLLETPKPPSSCDSWSRMSTQARSWVHVLYVSWVPFGRKALLIFQSTCCCRTKCCGLFLPASLSCKFARVCLGQSLTLASGFLLLLRVLQGLFPYFVLLVAVFLPKIPDLEPCVVIPLLSVLCVPWFRGCQVLLSHRAYPSRGSHGRTSR